MSDDLVKRAREYGDDPQDVSLGEWAEWSHKWADRIEELEAKLATATGALVQVAGQKTYADDPWAIARTTLAKLKRNKE